MSRWDEYYLRICDAVASNSVCLSRKIGAILVKDKSIISTGYNGPPRGVPPCSEREMIDDTFEDALHKRIEELSKMRYEDNKVDDLTLTMEDQKANNVALCPRQRLGFKSGQGLEFCIAGHAERNALINAARHGIPTSGATIYMNCQQCCKDCIIEIINAGIAEVVMMDWQPYDSESGYLIKESGLKVRLFDLGESK